MSRSIPFADLKSQYESYKAEIDKAVLDVMSSSMYIMGPEVEKLEKNLAAYVGARHALSVSSGTDALLLALMAYGIKAGDEVITTPFTFIATAEVIALCPPGISVLLPGELIVAEHMPYLSDFSEIDVLVK